MKRPRKFLATTESYEVWVYIKPGTPGMTPGWRLHQKYKTYNNAIKGYNLLHSPKEKVMVTVFENRQLQKSWEYE